MSAGEEYLKRLPGWRDALSRGLYPPETVVLEPCVWTELSRLHLGGKRCLDAGCGYGRFSRMMQRLGGDVESVDISNEMLSRVPADIRCVQADVGALPFREETFDFALSSLVLMTPAVRNLGAALAELWRVLRRRDGELLCVLVHPFTVCFDNGPLPLSERFRYHEAGVRSWPMRMSDGSVVTLDYIHRPLEHYFKAMRGLFVVTDVVEPRWSAVPQLPPGLGKGEEYYDCEYLIIRARSIMNDC